MAGFYETLLDNTGAFYVPATKPVFGNAVSALDGTANEKRIAQMRQEVNNAQNRLAMAQSAYNSYKSTPVKSAKMTTMDDYKKKLSALSDEVNSKQTALDSANNALTDYINRQESMAQSNQDAVNWGLAARNAEEQGLQNAMNAYSTVMGNEAVRNAIMNNAIGTIGNFGGGGK